MQAKLLRVLEERQVERVGGDRTIPVDVRVIVATHHNLDELVKKGVFRQDLYHRIYVFPLLLPGLRERVDDIPALVTHFAAQVAEQNGWKPKPFEPGAIEELERYTWPGNVRELRNVVERLLLLADGPVDAAMVRLALPVGADAARPALVTGAPAIGGTLAQRVDSFEREQLLAELKRHNQRMTDTAKALGLERSHLYKKCQALGIDLRALRRGEAGS
jgi:DNA-binding NtrC family response regulator